jgi:cysteine desulfuration protein SufE
VIAAVQDKPADEVATMDVAAALGPFDLKNQLSSNRTQGVPNMIALVKEHAARIAAG